MEISEELVDSNDQVLTIKRKRTFRNRPLTLSSGATMSSTSSADSTTYSSGICTEEDEDMANCLILLAQGRRHRSPMMETGAGFDVYDCKTCNRSFPSFQALGGHRASHKRPKSLLENHKKFEQDAVIFSPPVSLNKIKVHECSICRSEFSSGQALGGHMRRHRTSTTVEATVKVPEMKERNGFSLDLNLPAQEDDRREYKFQFTEVQEPIVFSGLALVDCYY